MLNLRRSERDPGPSVMTKSSPRQRSGLLGGRASEPRRPARRPEGVAPFSDYLERDQQRQRRERSRRRTIIISIGVHVVALAAVLLYSTFQVDELFSPSVGVKIMTGAKLPPGVRTAGPPPPPADPALGP